MNLSSSSRDLSQDFQIEENTEEAEDEPGEPKLLSISPRDKLSYVEDKRMWKENEKFEQDHPGIPRFLSLMQLAIMENKPADIVHFIVNDFLSETNQIRLRKELKDLKESKLLK